MATTGAAAAVFGAGCSTVHSALAIGTKQSQRQSDGSLKPLDLQKLALLEEMYKDTEIIVIDEVSMMTAILLGDVNTRLQQIKKTTALFGGLTILLAGDFQQLPPAVGTPTYTGILKAQDPTSESSTLHESRSYHLIGLFKIKYLTVFKRALDPKLKKYLGHIRDLKNKHPLNRKTSLLIEELKTLQATPDDISGDWKNALLCLLSNKERYQANFQMIILKAEEDQQVLVSWDNKITFPLNLPDCIEKHLRDEHAPGELRGYFLKDAPVILTQNVSPVLLVANGSPGKLHSLIFLDEQDRKIATKIINDAPRGTRVLLPKPPDYVLIALNAKILDAIQKNELLNINHLFADVAKDDFLVALPYTHDRYGKNKVKFGTEASTSTIKYDKFNYDLGYAVTAYKLQGATLDNVLIDLNQRPQGLKAMDLRALYVILSRVATMEKIKIMPFRNHPQKRDINKNNFLNYLENLSQCAELSAWKDCIDPITHLFYPFLYNRPVKKSKRVKK